MRPKEVTSTQVDKMRSMREAGASFRTIADALGVGLATVYYELNGRKSPRAAANDNHPDRVTVYAAHNGGCSSTSGYMPVSLRRIPTLDKPLLPCVANDNVPAMQVAA